MAKCQLEPNNFTPCQGMKLAMNGNMWNSKAKGFYVSQVTNFKTFETRVAGVVLRYGKTNEAIYINCCPFCTTLLDSQHLPPEVPSKPLEDVAVIHQELGVL
jgi:hypothetical protein